MMAAAVVAALLALAGAAPLEGGDHPLAGYNQSMALDSMYIEYMGWPGPVRGCVPVRGAGAELKLECSLGGTHLTLLADRAATYLKLECEMDGNVPAEITCEDLQNNTMEALRNHTAEAQEQQAGGGGGAGGAGGGRVLRSLAVAGCALRGPLRCLPALVGASDVGVLTLRAAPMPLLPDQLQGLSSLTHLRLIDLDENVTSLPYEALATLPALRRLDLRGGSLRLAADAAWRLPRLQALELSDGGLRDLPARAFLGLPELRNLSLWVNKIQTVDENAFEGLSQLECLSLNQNRLASLPAGALRPAPRLRVLQLYDNRLAALPDLRHLADLEQVWVNNRNQTTLVLSNDTFAGQTALRKLKLDWCGLEALPGGLLAPLPALAELSLRGNRLAALPPGLLARQARLRSLDLTHNRLTTLPRSLFTNASALEDLNLQNNQIESLPNGVFLRLASLQRLDLSHNKLKQLSPQVFDGLLGIRELVLSYNELALGAGADPAGRLESPLVEMRSLRRLALAHNRVRHFMDDWRDLHLLESLDLSYNEIEYLSDIDLQLLSEAEVDVRHNRIAAVQQLSLAELVAGGAELSRARFLLDDNPFLCDCHMYHFLAALARPPVAGQFDVGRARCASPPPLAATLLAEVPLAALTCPVVDCPANCTCTQRPENRSLELDCARVPDRLTAPEDARGPERWEALDGSAVRLRVRAPPADVSALSRAVRVLDLSGLGLAAAPAAARPAPHLTVDLSNNSLTTPPLALLEANVTVYLSGNPLACDCEHAAALGALQRRWARVADGAALRCAGGGWARAADPRALCAPRAALALGLGSGLAAALLVLLLFRFRTEVRLVLARFRLFDCLLPHKDLGSADKKYDAFVSFSHHDEAYVRAVLVPALEGGRRPLRLCLHYRDWEVGELIPAQIDRSVRDSWRTIVVLSDAFVRSDWGRHEFRAAHGLERVIVLVLGDALAAMDADRELRAYKRTHTCLMASHPLVWDRIRDAVYRSKCAAARKKPHDKPAKPAGGLDVQLQNGMLVNQAAPVPKPKKFPQLFLDFPFISSKGSSAKG